MSVRFWHELNIIEMCSRLTGQPLLLKVLTVVFFTFISLMFIIRPKDEHAVFEAAILSIYESSLSSCCICRCRWSTRLSLQSGRRSSCLLLKRHGWTGRRVPWGKKRNHHRSPWWTWAQNCEGVKAESVHLEMVATPVVVSGKSSGCQSLRRHDFLAQTHWCDATERPGHPESHRRLVLVWQALGPGSSSVRWWRGERTDWYPVQHCLL